MTKPKVKPPAKLTANQKAVQLKKLGLWTGNTRKKFDKKTRDNVTRIYRGFRDVAEKPSDFFKLKGASNATVSKAKQTGFKASKGTVFIPKGKATSAKLVSDVVVIRERQGGSGDTVKTSRVQLVKRKDFLSRLHAMSIVNVLPPDQYLMVRIGTARGFGASLDYKKLYGYVSKWETKDMHAAKYGTYQGKTIVYNGGKSLAELEEIRDDLVNQMYVVSYEKIRARKSRKATKILKGL